MSFVFAGLILVGAIALGFFIGFAESMATAPHYTSRPLWIIGWGVVLALVVASSHWWPHIGW